MADYKKALLGKEDFAFDTSRNNETFNRGTSTGGTQPISKVNASHIPVLSSLVWGSATNVQEFLVNIKAFKDAYDAFIANVGHWDKFLGFFADAATLISEHAAPTSDDVFAWNNDTKTFWHWDETLGTPAWADSHKTLSDETSPSLSGDLDTDGNDIDFGNDSGILNLLTLQLKASSEKTIASGSITLDSIAHSVDTESDDSEDYLVTMVPATNCNLAILKQEDSARSVIIQHSTGSNKFTLPNSKDIIMDSNSVYMFWHDGTSWSLIYSAYNPNNEGTLTDEANIDWNLRTSPRATVTLTDNRTMNAPTNMEAGGHYILRVVQDATGGRTLDFNPIYYTPPTVNLEANAVTVLYFYSDGTNMYGNAVDPDEWTRLDSDDYTGVDAFDLSTAGTKQTQAVSGETVHTGIAFNDDGTKVFLCGEATDAVREFDLSTAYDLSTISAVQVTMSTTSETSNPQAVCFNSAGTKMYILKQSASTIFQYDLSTGFDLSTASYSGNSFNINTELADTARGLEVSADATKIFAVGTNNTTVHQWTMTGGDVSTATSHTTFNASDATNSHSIAISSDGLRMAIGNNSNTVYSYTLSTAYDVSTASYDSQTLTLECSGLCFSSDGFAIAGCSGGNTYRTPLGTQNVDVTANKNYIITVALSQHTLPEEPTDGTTIRLRRFLSGSNHPTAVTQGSDTFDDASSELSLDTDKETSELIYNATSNEWEVY